jgi:DNA polymerase
MDNSEKLSFLNQVSEFEDEIILERPLNVKGDTISNENKVDQLNEVANLAHTCEKCTLSQTRKNVVFGVGNPNARLMFVGEGPGADEDRKGEPFVGRAGQLLDKMIVAMKFQREDVYIANIVKCRPPDNRNPLPIEVTECFPYLYQQIEIIEPDVIVALGLVAATNLLKIDTTVSVKLLRERVHNLNGRPMVVTYHPAALLRSSKFKAPAWQDLQYVMKMLSGVISWKAEAY